MLLLRSLSCLQKLLWQHHPGGICQSNQRLSSALLPGLAVRHAVGRKPGCVIDFVELEPYLNFAKHELWGEYLAIVLQW